VSFHKLLLAAIACGLVCGLSAAQPPSAFDEGPQPFAYAAVFDDEREADTSSDGPIAGTRSIAATYPCPDNRACDTFAQSLCHLGDGVELGKPLVLSDECDPLKARNIKFTGWLAQGYTWNPYKPADHFNGPVTWTDQANCYQMNELYLYAERPTDTQGDGWDLGGRVDLLYGTSYRWNTEAGLESTFDTGKFYGLAIMQFYTEVAYNDLKVKVGHFIGPEGFLKIGTANNFFNTVGYAFQYGEPFTYTGVWGQYQITEKINWTAGITHGWDNFDDTFNHHAAYLGTITINGDHKDTLAFVHNYSHEPTQNPAQAFSSRYLQTLVYSRPLTERWTAIFENDFGVQGHATSTAKTARWYGCNIYLYWKKNEVWSWGINGEWFRDEEGYRVSAAVPSPGSPFAAGWPLAPGFAGNFWQCTFGPRWTPLPNLVVRPNFRADWYTGTLNSQGLKPYDAGTKNFQQILGTDVVMTF
jgi:hypothetical protein